MHLAQISSIDSPGSAFPALAYSNLIGLLVSKLLIYAIAFAGLYFFIRLILAGFTYLTAMGEAAKLQEAQKTLINSVIGLIIVLAAFFVAQIVKYITGLNIV